MKLIIAGTTGIEPSRVSASRCSDAIASWIDELVGTSTRRDGVSSARFTDSSSGERFRPIVDSEPSFTPLPCTIMPGLSAVALAPTATMLSKLRFMSYCTTWQR